MYHAAKNTKGNEGCSQVMDLSSSKKEDGNDTSACRSRTAVCCNTREQQYDQRDKNKKEGIKKDDSGKDKKSSKKKKNKIVGRIRRDSSRDNNDNNDGPSHSPSPAVPGTGDYSNSTILQDAVCSSAFLDERENDDDTKKREQQQQQWSLWKAVCPNARIRKRIEKFLSPTMIALLTSFTAFLIGAIMLVLSRTAAAGRAAAAAAAERRSASYILSSATRGEIRAYRTYWTNLRATVASSAAAVYQPQAAYVARGSGSGNNNNDDTTTANYLMPLELNIPDTPAWQALDWMTLQDPVQFESLLLPVDGDHHRHRLQLKQEEERDRILQRFALVVLYFLSPGIWKLRSTADGWPAALTDRRPYRFRGTAASISTADAVVEELDSNVTSVLHECSWLGVTCDGRDRVTGLELSGGDQVPIVLQGTVPVELGLLTDLRALDLSRQGLRGAFPGEVLYPQWKQLQELRMGMNALTSTGMTTSSGTSGRGSVNKATQTGTDAGVVSWKDSLLEVVDWHENQLQDKVPLEALQALPHLRILNLKSNPRLTGPLFLGSDGSSNGNATSNATTTESSLPPAPSQGQQPSSSVQQQLWPKLEVLEISSTGTTGTLLQSNMPCTHLIKMDVSKTRMSFELPEGIGRCTALRHLTAHSLYAPALHGTLPEALGGCTSLRTLELQYNRIRGTLPSEAMGKLRSLEYLNLEGNRFTGTLPTTLGQMTSLEILQVTRNQFNGTPPAQLAHCASLQQVFLQRNEFAGIIPPEICKMNLYRLEADCDRSQSQTQRSYNHPFQCSCCVCYHGF